MACKNNIILNSTCIISSITCVALTFWGQIKNNGTITTDSYIGIIASLIGICATIVVGFQITSFFELRNLKQQIDQVEKQRKDLELYKATISNERKAKPVPRPDMSIRHSQPTSSKRPELLHWQEPSRETRPSTVVRTYLSKHR